MMETLTIHRSGDFRHVTRGGGKCGTPDNQTYMYRVRIKARGDLEKAPNRFLIDNNAIQEYFERTYPPDSPVPGVSCEVMAQHSCRALRHFVARNGWDVREAVVQVSGSAGKAWLECRYEADDEPAVSWLDVQ